MNITSDPAKGLPVNASLSAYTILSLIVALLMAAASIAGLVDGRAVYESDELYKALMPNDIINLVIGLPILLVSVALARRGRLLGLLFWPGALFYVLYNYLAYLYSAPLSWAYPLYLTLVTLSVYGIIGLVGTIDGTAVQRKLAGRLPERGAGGVLIALGALFMVRGLGLMSGALASGEPIPTVEFSVLMADFVTSPAMIVGGILLWRKRPLGYAAGLGLLFQASMLFVGLIGFLLLQPLITDVSLLAADIVVVAVMGLVCFVPFGLFVRGVAAAESKG